MTEYKEINKVLYRSGKPIALLLDISEFKLFLKDKENFNIISRPVEEKGKSISDFVGALNHYANPELIEKEKDAWKNAVKEKYAC